MSGALSAGVLIGLSLGVNGLMIGGAIKKRIAPVLPHDAPATMPGETPWYSGQLLPVQIGVYKRLSVGEVVLYSYFDGAHWFWNCRTSHAAAAMRQRGTEFSLVQTLPWCGLASPPPSGYGPLRGEEC